jgi:hypothetical protein
LLQPATYQNGTLAALPTPSPLQTQVNLEASETVDIHQSIL